MIPVLKKNKFKKNGTSSIVSPMSVTYSRFLIFCFNTLVLVWIVNLLAWSKEGAAAPELSILLEGLPECARRSSSEGSCSESLSPAIQPDQWLAQWWANFLVYWEAKRQGERGALSSTFIMNLWSKICSLHSYSLSFVTRKGPFYVA